MSNLPLEGRAVGWRFWGFWMGATIAAGVVSLILAIPVDWIMLNRPFDDSQFGQRSTEETLFVFVVTGVATVVMAGTWGIGQWMVLRRELKGAGWWIPATALGLAIGGLAGSNLRVDLPAEIGRVLHGSIFFLTIGLALGIAQWFVLNRRVRHAGWWILITPAAWICAFLFTGLFVITGTYIEPMDMLFAFLVPTALGGAALVWLLRQTPRLA